MPVKVLQLINAFAVGGAELMAKRLALGFDRNRVTCDIWSVCRGPSEAGEQMFLSDLNDSGVSHQCLDKKPGLKDPRTIGRLIRHMHAQGYDVVHAHCPSPSFYGRLAAAAVPRARSMVTLHQPMTPGEVRMERVLSRVTGLYVACSSEIVTDLRDRCRLAESKFIRILNGTAGDRTGRVATARDDLRGSLGVTANEPVALVLGRIDRQKAQLDVMEALTREGHHLRRLKVWLVGDDRINPDYTRRVREFIDAHGLGPRVKIWGVVDDEDIGRLMKAADLFLLPTEREGLSVAILEALGAGMPTVISDLPNNREASDNGRVAWLIRPHAVDELAHTLEHMLADPASMKARGREAAEFVRTTFGFERVIEEYSSAYERLSRRPS